MMRARERDVNTRSCHVVCKNTQVTLTSSRLKRLWNCPIAVEVDQKILLNCMRNALRYPPSWSVAANHAQQYHGHRKRLAFILIMASQRFAIDAQ